MSISTNFFSPLEIVRQIGEKAREKRLSLNMSQQTLAEKSGVSLGVLKKFEASGKISLESLLKLAVVLDSLEEFQELFKPLSVDDYPSLDAILKQKKRMRGRT